MKSIKTNLADVMAKAEKAFKVSQGVRKAADEQTRMAQAAKPLAPSYTPFKGK
jgi:hypothetical protein